MRVVYFTGGLSGSGHVVLGLTIANAITRAGLPWDFEILSFENPFLELVDRLGVRTTAIPYEDEQTLGPEGYPGSVLYRTIMSKKPDILVVDLFWYAFASFLRELPCRKVLLVRQVDPGQFWFRTPFAEYRFHPEDWDLVLRTEPGFELPFVSGEIPPLIIRNRDEILPRQKACQDLGLQEGDDACLFAFNGASGEGAQVWKSFSYLQDEGWKVIRSDNRQGGLFPAVDWFNAFDLLVCGAGYSSFWEARYFRKQAFFTPFPRRFEDPARRVRQFADYEFEENGADRLINLLTRL